MSAYDDFIARKALVVPATGIKGTVALSPKLKEHQRLLTEWALRRGRAAIFADTGLGKGWMVLEWARAVAWYTGKPVLVLAPLAVAQQFQREAAKLWLAPELTICSSQTDVGQGVNVTNYQKLHKFDLSQFAGVALDESSILKSLDGKTRAELIEACRDVPFRLSATATPSPNDHTELGGQAEFLGVMKHVEMLATFFINDTANTGDWRLKGHARESFWKWVCSWGAIVKMPSDLGCSDDGYILPPLVYHEHVVPADHQQAHATGLLFAQAAETLTDQRRARKETLSRRVQIAAGIANMSSARGPVIVWCDLNNESEALARAIDDSVELTGSMSDEEKEEAIRQFVEGEKRVLVSKPKLCGFGLNFQFARTVVFCGVTHSFEAFYQAVRRSWRFGVEGDVNVHVVSSELEGRVVESLKLKAAAAAELSSETSKFVARFVRASLGASARETMAYEPMLEVQWPKWLKTGRAA